jgi:arginine:agmatine antiporter
LGAVVAIGAAISSFGSLNGWILIVGQLPLAVARDGMFPSLFGRLSSRGVPLAGMLIAGLFSTGLIALNYQGSPNLVGALHEDHADLDAFDAVPYVFCSLAVFLPAATAPRPCQVDDSWRRWRSSMRCLRSRRGADVVYLGFLLILGGLPVYVWVKRGREA